MELYLQNRRATLAREPGGCRDTDAQLVRRARGGDDSAFHELVDRHAGRLFGLAMSLLGNAADAEDVLQETLAGAVRGLRGFRGHASVKTWLTRILVNKVARLRRSQRLRRAAPLEAALEAPLGDPPAGATATQRADIRMDVAAVLTRLSEDHRAVILLREMQQMSYEEMADALGVPRGTVESRLFRARQKLKELLKDYLP
jgi:RNA polymerase sigma-70 factor (ECF subfamily)